MTGLKIERINTPEPMLNFLEESGMLDTALNAILHSAKTRNIEGSPHTCVIKTAYNFNVHKHTANISLVWDNEILSYSEYLPDRD